MKRRLPGLILEKSSRRAYSDSPCGGALTYQSPEKRKSSQSPSIPDIPDMGPPKSANLNTLEASKDQNKSSIVEVSFSQYPHPRTPEIIPGGSAGTSGTEVAASAGRPPLGFKPLPMPSPPPLDRSAYIPRIVLPVHEGMENIFEFAARFSPELAATGLARCTVKVPSLAAYESVEPESHQASMQLLERALGKSYRMHCYSYEFDRLSREVRGCYIVRYQKTEPSYTPSKFHSRTGVEGSRSPFSSIPFEGEFADEPYWQAVEASSQDHYNLHYPSDIEASVCAHIPDFPLGWDMSKFSAKSELLRALVPYLGFKDEKIAGYTTPMLYVGSAGTTFALHSEDQNLFSCNYLLAGCPKVWYGVPPSYYSQVISLISTIFAEKKIVQQCPQAVMHKRFLLNPEVLHAAGIPTSRVIQRPGDMIITSPGAFHFGYNTGWNIAEASNFASDSWWTGGHFHDALAVGQCACKEMKRFTFDDDDVRAGLLAIGVRVCVYPFTLAAAASSFPCS